MQNSLNSNQAPECWWLAKTFEQKLKQFLLRIKKQKQNLKKKTNPQWFNFLSRRQNYFSSRIAYFIEQQKIQPNLAKKLTQFDEQLKLTRQALGQAALSKQSYLEEAALLIAQLDLLFLSFGEEFGLPRGYNLLPPQFSPEQIKIAETFKKDSPKGLKLAWRYLAQEPNNRITYALISDLYMSLGEHKKALLFLELGSRYNPNDYIIHYLWGVALAKVWRLHKSVEVLKRAIRLKSDDIEIQKNLGWSTVMLGRFRGDKKMLENGRNILKNALSHDPTNVLIMTDLSQSYLMEHKIYTAFKWAKRAFEIAPQDEFVQAIYQNLSEIYQSYKQDKAFQEFIRSQTLKSLPPEVLQRSPEEIDEYLARKFEIETILEKLERGEITSKEAQRQLSAIGEGDIVGQIISIENSNSLAARVAREYIEFHKKIPNVEEKISPPKLEKIIDKLFSSQTKEEELKKTILILAHQGNKKALQALEKKMAQSRGWLKLWLKLAIDECKTFLSYKNKKDPKVIFKKV